MDLFSFQNKRIKKNEGLDKKAENDSESEENQGDDFQFYRQIKVYNKFRLKNDEKLDVVNLGCNYLSDNLSWHKNNEYLVKKKSILKNKIAKKGS